MGLLLLGELNKAELILALAPWIQAAWVFAFGSCIGSLLNVLVYRLPLGLDVVTPTSRCPSCETKLTWRENIPVFGWLMLRGRCRFCGSKISAEYPIVEAFTGLLWVAVWVVAYGDPGRVLGVNLGVLQPDWARGGFADSWPIFIGNLGLFSCLIAITLIDARTFHIPMALVITPVVLGGLAHGGWVLVHGALRVKAPGWEWALATPGVDGWAWVGAAWGGVLGLVIANVLLAKGVIRRSFADYDEWLATQQAAGTGEGAEQADDPEMWVRYPHARREMVRELIFLAPCVGLALVGAALAIRWAGPWVPDLATGGMRASVGVPLWVSVVTGVALGYVVGGGVVWAMRIVGSLGFGKEALGLGDVHLMAAVGACLGWVDAVLAFFGAALVGVVWAVLGKLASGRLTRHMPFGPYLAVSTVLVWFGKTWIEQLMGLVLHSAGRVHLP